MPEVHARICDHDTQSCDEFRYARILAKAVDGVEVDYELFRDSRVKDPDYIGTLAPRWTTRDGWTMVGWQHRPFDLAKGFAMFLGFVHRWLSAAEARDLLSRVLQLPEGALSITESSNDYRLTATRDQSFVTIGMSHSRSSLYELGLQAILELWPDRNLRNCIDTLEKKDKTDE